MERTMSVEDKIRRAEEIYARRKQENGRTIATVNVNNTEKKDIKLLKKMLIQIVICISIYLVIYAIQNNNYIFSQDFINKANEVLSYDTNFYEIYENIKQYIMNMQKETKEEYQEQNEQQENVQEQQNEEQINAENLNSIGGAVEDVNSQENAQEQENIQTTNNENAEQQLSQMEQDVISVKNTTTFIKPVQGSISSPYGQREEATGSVPKNHTGTDIAANQGTKIISATNGEVVLASTEGDYRNSFKDTNR